MGSSAGDSARLQRGTASLLLLATAGSLAGCDLIFELKDPAIDARDKDGAIAAGDEDGDGFTNDVDNCPGRINFDQSSNNDADPLGNICDPNPGDDRDRFAEREFFDSELHAWTPDSTASWRFVPGKLVTANAASIDAIDSTLQLASASVIPTVEVGFTVVDYGGSGVDNELSVSVAKSGATATCRVFATGGFVPISFMDISLNGTGVANGNPGDLEPDGTSIHTLRVTVDPLATTCDIDGTIATAAPPGSPSQESATITLGVRSAQIEIHYILLYDVGP